MPEVRTHELRRGTAVVTPQAAKASGSQPLKRISHRARGLPVSDTATEHRHPFSLSICGFTDDRVQLCDHDRTIIYVALKSFQTNSLELPPLEPRYRRPPAVSPGARRFAMTPGDMWPATCRARQPHVSAATPRVAVDASMRRRWLDPHDTSGSTVRAAGGCPRCPLTRAGKWREYST